MLESIVISEGTKVDSYQLREMLYDIVSHCSVSIPHYFSPMNETS